MTQPTTPPPTTVATTLTVKCRYPANSFTLSQLPVSLNVAEFQDMLEQRTGISASMQILKTGFPPRPLALTADPASTQIGTLLSHGDLVVIDERQSEETTTTSPDETTRMTEEDVPYQSGSFPVLPSSIESSSEMTTTSLDGIHGPLLTSYSNPDEELDRAIALSLSENIHISSQKDDFEPEPIISDRLTDGSYMVRRFVDSDNSCLFTAVAYVMEGNRLRGFDLRSVIADTVRSDPLTYNEAFLGRANAEYCEWIVNPQHWGGEIELVILSQHYQRQIATYDIQTTNCYVYGSDAGFAERVMLLYDGIHYDALARSPYKDAPEEFDSTIYDPLSFEGRLITEAAVQLVRKFHEGHQYTNTSTFQLRCDDCGRGFTGTSPAVDHERVTGHTRFSEYR